MISNFLKNSIWGIGVVFGVTLSLFALIAILILAFQFIGPLSLPAFLFLCLVILGICLGAFKQEMSK